MQRGAEKWWVLIHFRFIVREAVRSSRWLWFLVAHQGFEWTENWKRMYVGRLPSETNGDVIIQGDQQMRSMAEKHRSWCQKKSESPSSIRLTNMVTTS
jgi:hypothetical protein